MKSTSMGVRNFRISSNSISRDQSILLSLGILFLTGVLSGTIIAIRIDGASLQFIHNVFEEFMASRTSQSLSSSFINSLISNVSLLILSTLFGFCAIGAPMIFLLPYFKGLGFGVLVSSILLLEGTKAISYVILLIIPTTLIITIALIISCKESLKVSLELYRTINPATRNNVLIKINDFIAKNIVLILVAVGVSVLESYLFSEFGNNFFI